MGCETTVIQVSDCSEPTLVDNLNGTHTFDPGDGNVITFPTKYLANATYSEITENLTLTLSDGTTYIVNIPAGVSGGSETITTLVDNLDGSFTYTSEDATVTVWSETVTTLVDNLDGTLTYTSEDGTVVTIDFGETVTTLVNNLDGTITYTDEAGTPTVLDICAIIDYCTLVAANISDFDTEVSNNIDVAANTSARHVAVTVTDSAEINFTLVGQDITGSIVAGSIDETKLDVSVNASLNLADSSLQPSYSGSSNIVTLGTVTSGNVDAIISSASTTVQGKVELATSAETTTGTDTGRAVTPDGLAGSNYGIRVVSIQVTDPAGSAITTGDGKAYFRVPSVLNGYNLVGVAAHVTTVSSSGLPTVQIHNVTDTVDMLSTALTIDENEKDSKDATIAAVINTSNDDVATGDELRIDVDLAGTGTKGLIVEMQFQLP